MSDTVLRNRLIRLANDLDQGSDERKKLLTVLAEFDPHEIGEVKPGPLEIVEPPDEPWMDPEFTQQEFHELGEKQEAGDLATADPDGPAKLPSGQLDRVAEEKALFDGLVRLASENKEARGPILGMLREAGYIDAKGEVPEAFKKQWKNKDKDNDGKENEPKPDFLKKKEEEAKDKKASPMPEGDSTLRDSLIRLANDNPSLRKKLLPVITGSDE